MSEQNHGGLPSVEAQREALRQTVIDAPRKSRILMLGRFANGPTDVVAALKRSLDNLGHTVLHLDTDRHGSLVDNRERARGGFGPIYVRADGLRPYLDRFRPQVMVFCAGGLVLASEDAEALREREILLLGITLSDPDVQPSVLPHVERFDYHTTNSMLALDRYRRAGVRNTLPLPFGIDRDFVVQRVPPLPDLSATAVCIGHAVGRPERQEVMAAVAERVKVRVYGQGWTLPDAEIVCGTRLVQAAREGTFHVDFPGTRAGYANVKCGVFESVGAGAVLCTEVFDEMRRFFAYGDEIVGYGSAADLADQIEALLADPDAVETMRRRSFRRLVREHLYEHRWLDLFARIEADLVGDCPAVGAERAAVLRRALASGASRPRVVVLSGYYGAGNTGDDLLLESIAQGVERHVVDAYVHVAGVDPRAVESNHGRPAIDRRDLPAAEELAAKASAVVLGGGGLWHDYTFHGAGGLAGMFQRAKASPTSLAQLPLMARVHRRPFHVFGMGVGPLADPDTQAVVRFTADQADSISVRDAESVRLLEAIPGWSAPVERAPDPVYALPLPPPSPVEGPAELAAGGPLLALNLRPWSRGLSPAWLRSLGQQLEELACRHRLAVVGIPMTGQDARFLGGFLAERDLPRGHVVLPWTHDPTDLLGVLSASRLVISMRLHACLLAHRLGTPAIGLAYDPKVTRHFVELDRGELALELDEVPALLKDRVERALTEGGSLPADVRRRVAGFERLAGQALNALAARIAAAPLVLPPPAKLTPAPPDPLVVPPGWNPVDAVDIATGRVYGSNLATGEPVEVAARRRPGAVRFHMTATSPRAGDFAAWQVRLDNTPARARRAELLVTQAYPENPRRRGRMAYQILLDGVVLLEEDVAAWDQRNTVWVAWNSTYDSVLLEVRSLALRDCEPWNWGRGGAVVVEALRVVPWAGDPEQVLVGASSPRSTRGGAGGADARAAGPPSAGARRAPRPRLRQELGRGPLPQLRRRLSRWQG